MARLIGLALFLVALAESEIAQEGSIQMNDAAMTATGEAIITDELQAVNGRLCTPVDKQCWVDAECCSARSGECSGAIKVGDVVSAAEAGERDLVLGEVCEFYEEGQGLRMLLRRFLGASELRQRCLNREALQDQELVDSKEVVELPVLAILEKVQVVSEEDYLSYVEDETLDLAALGSDSGPFFCRRQIESSGTLWPAAWDHESRKKRREEHLDGGHLNMFILLVSLRDWRPRSTTGREVGAAASSASRSELLPRAAAALKAGAAAGMLPGRETEQERVMQFLRSAVQEGGRKEVLYVSGVPGTGKTASVLEAVRRLQISRSG
eukprot:g9412.t1